MPGHDRETLSPRRPNGVPGAVRGNQVTIGVYASASEVVRAGLRLLIERDEARRANSLKVPRERPRSRS